MTAIHIEGVGRVEVDDSFMSLSPQDQDRTVQEIASQVKKPASFNERFGDVQPPKKAGLIAKTLEPLTSYPEVYEKMQRDSRVLMQEGIDQASAALPQQVSADSLLEFGKGAGKTLLGGVGYIASPVNAALRTVVGKPFEENTGAPKEYTEFAAGLALPGVGFTRAPNMVRSGQKVRIPSREELKDAATAGYRSEEVSAVTLKPEVLQSYSQKTMARLFDEGFDENLAPKTFGVLSKAAADAPDGATVTGKNVESLRRTLGRVAASNDPTERMAASEAMRALDSFYADVAPATVIAGNPARAAEITKEARGNYAAAKRSEQIASAEGRAELAADAAGSGANIDNSTRQQIKAILNNPKKLRGFSAEEIEQMREVVRGGPIRNTARWLGKLAPTGAVSGVLSGGAGAVGGSAVGGTLGGGIGAIAVPSIGYASKKLSDFLTAREMTKLDEVIRSRSPLAKSVGRPLIEWGKAAKAVEQNPTARTVSMFSIASRNLSNNLKDAGINISADDLMRSISGPNPSSAEDE